MRSQLVRAESANRDLQDQNSKLRAALDGTGQDYKKLRADLRAAIKQPGDEIAERQRNALPSTCAYQILLELGWLAKYCTDWDIAQQRLVELKDREHWRPGLTKDALIAEMTEKSRMPGVTTIWQQPIRNRIDMLATGIPTQVGIKVFGPDLAVLERTVSDERRRLHDILDLLQAELVHRYKTGQASVEGLLQ